MGSEVPCLWSPGGVGGNWVLTVLMLASWGKLDMAGGHYCCKKWNSGSLTPAPLLCALCSVCSHELFTLLHSEVARKFSLETKWTLQSCYHNLQ